MTTTDTDKLSNRNLADALDIHYTYASRLKNGLRLPSRELMYRAQDAFELTDEQMTEWSKLIRDQGAHGSAQFIASNLR